MKQHARKKAPPVAVRLFVYEQVYADGVCYAAGKAADFPAALAARLIDGGIAGDSKDRSKKAAKAAKAAAKSSKQSETTQGE